MAMLLLAGCGWLKAGGAYHRSTHSQIRGLSASQIDWRIENSAFRESAHLRISEFRASALYCFLVFFRHAILAMKGERNLVDDHVRARVAKNQVPADKAVLDIAWQIGQRQQDIRRHRGKR